MIKHIDVALYLLILKKQYPFLTNKALQEGFNEAYNLPITMRDIHMIETQIQEIPTKQLVHGLRSKGYNVAGIASLLDISSPAVSQHLKSPPKKEYICPVINGIIKTYQDKKFAEWQSH